MALLDVDHFFTNVPLDETIKFVLMSCLNFSGLNKNEIFEMLSLTLKESVILFDNSQIDRAVMGSPLRPTLANIVLCYHGSNWLNDCPKDFKSSKVYYKRYVDDNFCFVS